MRPIVVIILTSLAASGCAHTRISRERDTYTAEVFAGLQRERAAADALMLAAEAALQADDIPACRAYSEPALVIQAKAQPQAFRALWLAGIAYPLEDGSLPEEGVEQEDPGAAPPVLSVDEVCPDLPE